MARRDASPTLRVNRADHPLRVPRGDPQVVAGDRPTQRLRRSAEPPILERYGPVEFDHTLNEEEGPVGPSSSRARAS